MSETSISLSKSFTSNVFSNLEYLPVFNLFVFLLFFFFVKHSKSASLLMLKPAHTRANAELHMAFVWQIDLLFISRYLENFSIYFEMLQ